jgi:hypothetical protein
MPSRGWGMRRGVTRPAIGPRGRRSAPFCSAPALVVVVVVGLEDRCGMLVGGEEEVVSGYLIDYLHGIKVECRS